MPVCRTQRRGFTIIETMIVVTIIGILAVLVIPALQRARLRTRNVEFMNNLRLLSGETFDYYAFEFGDLPPDSPPGIEPVNVGPYLPRRFAWGDQTAIGGLWDWDRAPDRASKIDGIFYGGLSVNGPERTTAQMRDIDELLDDGDLSSGQFRFRSAGLYTYIIEF